MDSFIVEATTHYARSHQSPLSNDIDRLHKWHRSFVWVLQEKLRYYEKFLCHGAQNAQNLIDVTQTMLDAEWVDGQFKSILEFVLLRLAQVYQLYPKKILLKDVLHHNALLAYNNLAVRSTHNGKIVSVKVSGSRLESSIFRRHIVMWTRLCHENVLPVYGMCIVARYDDLGQYNGVGIVSPFMMNSNIISFLKENTVADRKSFILDVALGMSYLHDNGVIHGRIHGGNILIAHNPLRACLADFGLALVHPADPRAAPLLAPELDVPCPPYPPMTKASDVYAFSITCYKILTSSEIVWSPESNPSNPDDSGIDQLTWNVFLDSRRRSPDLRPTANQIVDRLKEITTPEKQRVERLKSIFNVTFTDSGHYKQFLSCTRADAQRVLDTFQLLLDTGDLRLEDRNKLIVAMRRLSERTELYPSRFFLKLSPPTAEDIPIAYGGFADVYRKTLPGHDICVKMIRMLSAQERLAKLYAREVIIWGQLSHPNILPFYGLLKYGARLCLISRWANNGNLNGYLKNNPTANRILLCLDMAAGVEYLHDNDIVHGDLKGVNVLVDNSGRACLGDFGLSSVTDPEILKWTSQSTEASSGGTARWQAPEIHNSKSFGNTVHNSKESDVFAWACTCYEAFTGHYPFYEIDKNYHVANAITAGKTPTRPDEDDPAWSKHHLNDRIWRLLENCWNSVPSARPNISDIALRLGADKPTDYRPSDDWEERASMRFRMAHSHDKKNLPKELSSLWESLEDLLSRIVPGAFEG